VRMDEEGFITIVGRAKRFAKIGGEMVSLSAVEEMVARAWPGSEHAVISVPDTIKGEQLVLVTTRADAHRAELLEYARAEGIAEISIPKKIIVVKQLPVLGTGKTDYSTVQGLVNQQFNN
jgi:acyl-[acyl-carrier-protein]-phospholipid O-acyltransferase/long-chain-fatty-acid--[acyl-carrier-protein] ligase